MSWNLGTTTDMYFRRVAVTFLLCLSLLPTSATQAQEADAAALYQVVVSANRSEQRIMDTAASINLLNSWNIHDGQPEENLSEPLERVPGIFALNRQNYAQDLLISSRGFGANSTFGARGIKIFVDGIPGTVADGQSQISNIDLPSADHIEVMRGPFSALYGNSAGGVINVFTENGKPGMELTPYFSVGSFGQLKVGMKLDGEQDAVNYVLDVGKLHTDGYRDHSATDRNNENAKLNVKIGDDTILTVVANSVNLNALDPLGLTTSQLRSEPRAPGTGAALDDTRKSVDQTQGGLVFTQRIGANDSFALSSYDGERHTVQFLASMVNGVVNLERDYYGLNGKWLHTGEIDGMPVKLVAGAEGNENQDHRLTFVNNGGLAQAGTTDQDYAMEARNFDLYFQGELRPTDVLSFNAGVRQSKTTLSAISNNTLPSLGEHGYNAATAMASAQYYVQANTNIYFSLGSGFDTPTLNQIIYSPAYVLHGASNIGNIGLAAARTQQAELGLKSEIPGTAQITVAVFDANTSNDVVIAASNGGKTAYLNAPKTSREGLELTAQWHLSSQFLASAAYTFLDAKVRQTYSESAVSTPSLITSYTVKSGNRIPGVPDQGLFAELMWRKPDKSLEFAVEGKASGSIAANDLNQAYSSGYGIVNLRAIGRQTVGNWAITEFARVDNVFDRTYVGSVIVNQAASQFYESAPGRNWLTGIKAAYKF